MPIGSTICLYLRNPNYSLDMSMSRKGFNLTAMTLEISSYTRLHKEIGQKSKKVTGLSFLGIKARKVELMDGVM